VASWLSLIQVIAGKALQLAPEHPHKPAWSENLTSLSFSSLMQFHRQCDPIRHQPAFDFLLHEVTLQLVMSAALPLPVCSKLLNPCSVETAPPLPSQWPSHCITLPYRQALQQHCAAASRLLLIRVSAGEALQPPGVATGSHNTALRRYLCQWKTVTNSTCYVQDKSFQIHTTTIMAKQSTCSA
jgi:hypothetical protein